MAEAGPPLRWAETGGTGPPQRLDREAGGSTKKRTGFPATARGSARQRADLRRRLPSADRALLRSRHGVHLSSFLPDVLLPSEKPKRLAAQWSALNASLVFVFLPVTAMLLAAGLVVSRTSLPVEALFADSVDLAQLPYYYGALSNIGVLLWCSTATGCLLVYAALRAHPTAARERRFLLWMGLLTAWLMMDDLFLLHEVVLPDKLGLPSAAVYAVYAATTLAVLLRYRAVVVQSDSLLLLVAGCFFGISVLSDLAADVAHVRFKGRGFLEDGCKLLGIAGWFSYLVCFSAGLLGRATQRSPLHGRGGAKLKAASSSERPRAQN